MFNYWRAEIIIKLIDMDTKHSLVWQFVTVSIFPNLSVFQRPPSLFFSFLFPLDSLTILLKNHISLFLYHICIYFLSDILFFIFFQISWLEKRFILWPMSFLSGLKWWNYPSNTYNIQYTILHLSNPRSSYILYRQ